MNIVNPAFTHGLHLLLRTVLALLTTIVIFNAMYALISTEEPAWQPVKKTRIPPFVMPETAIESMPELEKPQIEIPQTPPAREKPQMLDNDASHNPHSGLAVDWQREKFTLQKPSRREATPVFRVNPVYPHGPLQRGIEGFVDLGFDIDEKGATQNITVIAAQPERVFNKAAIKAVSKWRYEPRVIDGEGVYQSGLSTRIRFTISSQ